MKLFNKVKKEEQKENQKKENKILKFIKEHKFVIGGTVMVIGAAAMAFIISDGDDTTYDVPNTPAWSDKPEADDTEFGQPRYDVGIDDAFATVLYSDGEVDFVGKDYIMNLAELIVDQRKKEESNEQV